MKYNYEAICEKFKKFCIENNKIPTKRELTKLGFPQAKWLVDNSEDNITSYPQFLEFLGFKPHYNITKAKATKLIIIKANNLNRNPKIEDFYDPKFDEIGIRVIKRIWGSFNNMMVDLGFGINKESMTAKVKSIEELENDIFRLCEYIKETENRNIIAFSDIDNCNWCLDSLTYDKNFRSKKGISLIDFIQSLGFKTNKCGMGMVFQFDDGEITTSKFEFQTSSYLKLNNYKYKRNHPYTEIYYKYNGKKDCDYVIETFHGEWFVEIAGMLDYTKVNKDVDDPIRRKYKKGLEEKEQMLQSANLNYKIIFPEEFYSKSAEEVFCFLKNI